MNRRIKRFEESGAKGKCNETGDKKKREARRGTPPQEARSEGHASKVLILHDTS